MLRKKLQPFCELTMTEPNKIPYYFETPIPRYFRENGWFKCEHMFKFIHWAFARCQTIPHIEIKFGKEIHLAPYEFIAGRLSSPAECFLSENIFRNQLLKLEKGGFLKKTTNSLTNKYSCYIWVTERFGRINNQQNNQQTTNRQPTDHHEERTKNIELKKQQQTPAPLNLIDPVGSVVCSVSSNVSICLFGCLADVSISENDKIRLSKEFKEIDVIRAVAVLKERKSPPGNVMGFLLSAIHKGYKPNKNPEIELSERAKTNKRLLFEYVDWEERQPANKLKIKDLKIIDNIDHALFGTHKIPYDCDDFNSRVANARVYYNLIKQKIKPIDTQEIKHSMDEYNQNIINNKSAANLANGILDKVALDGL